MTKIEMLVHEASIDGMRKHQLYQRLGTKTPDEVKNLGLKAFFEVFETALELLHDYIDDDEEYSRLVNKCRVQDDP